MNKLKTSAYAPVNGINLYYEIHGEGGIPLVLIHGGGSTIDTSFAVTLPMFASHGMVIAVELQAHGRTSDRDAPETFQQDADDVAALLKFLKIDKADILGFSNGGTTTMQIAIRHPDVVNKIVVVSAAYQREGFMTGFFDGMALATLETMPAPLQESYLKVTQNNTSGLRIMFEKDKQRMLTFKDWPDDDLRSIKAPALIVTGDRDVTPTEHALKMSRLISGAQLLVVPGNHGSFIGESCSFIEGSKMPEITVAAIEEFLKN